MSTTYCVHERRAHMPSSCWGASHYVRISIVAHPSGKEICHWDRIHDGITERCEAARVRQKAKAIIALLERSQLMAHLAQKAGKILCQDARLDGDYLACRSEGSGVIIRYDASWRRIGVAVLLPKTLSSYGKYEHGMTLRQCRTEIASKLEILAAAKYKEQETARDIRRVHLGLALCHNLRVTYKHAKAAGMCDVGIRAYCKANNLDVDSGATLKQLRVLPDNRYLPAANVAMRAALVAHKLHKVNRNQAHAEAS